MAKPFDATLNALIDLGEHRPEDCKALCPVTNSAFVKIQTHQNVGESWAEKSFVEFRGRAETER